MRTTFAAAPIVLLFAASGSCYTLQLSRAASTVTASRSAVSMFFESQRTEAEIAADAAAKLVVQSRKHHASELVTERTGCSVVVTEGKGAFYGSRNLIQMLHDFGNHKSITAHGDSVSTAKKALLTRQARYSGLIDTLDFSEGALTVADAWLAINADEAALPAQIAAAKEAGIAKVFLLLTEDGPTPCPSDSAAMESMLRASGLTFTVMRTGNLVEEASSGGGLRIDAIDLPVCGDVSKEDVYRFVVEALTLPEAEGRLFSLCPSAEVEDSLKQMRLCGYERRDEVRALLKGLIVPPLEEEKMSEEEAAEQKELVLRSEAEIAKEREEELKALLTRARERGEKVAAKLKFEEEEKARQRAEMSKYYSAPKDEDEDPIASLQDAVAEAKAQSDEEPPKEEPKP